MGCNESKQAVATSNTISRRPFRKKLSIKPKDFETIPENILHIVPTNPSAVQQQVESNNDRENAVKNASVNNNDIDLKTEQQPDEVHEKVDEDVVNAAEGGDDQELGKSITSPDHYFSSRKDEDATESVGTNDEGYFSPNHDSVRDIKDDIELKEEANDDDMVNEKSLANDEHETSLIEEEEKIGNADISKRPNMAQADDQVKAVEPTEEVAEVTRIEDRENPIISQDSSRDFPNQDTKTS